MSQPRPVAITVCSECGLSWDDHRNLATTDWVIEWRKQHGYVPFPSEIEVPEITVDLSHCVRLLALDRQGPPGPPGPMGPQGVSA